jgi:hypothetical protein
MDLALTVLTQVSAVLAELDIRYVVVGSLASSLHGMYRSTADIDILADVKAEQVLPLLEVLQKNFYVDEHAIREAVTERSSFNAIHFDSVFKVDIFIPKGDDFAHSQLQRRYLQRIPDREADVYVATAEDTILAKLRMYKEGNEALNTQWADVVGILGTNGTDLDVEYLNSWAEKLGLTDLLQKAIDESS